jgi:hypothetical protein
MCNFFSCILKRNGDVLSLPYSDSHDDIIEENKLDDSSPIGSNARNWMRVEIQPPNGDVFEKNIKNWKISIDEQIKEEWYMRNQIEFDNILWDILRKELKKVIIVDRCVHKVVNMRVFLGRNGIVKNVSNNGIVENVQDNGIVENVQDNGIVKNVKDNGIVEYVRDNGIVENVQDNGTVEYVRGNGTVKYVRGNGTVKYILGNGIVRNVRDNGIVDYVQDNGIVDYVRDNGIVEYVRDNGIVRIVRGNGIVRNVRDNGIVENVQDNGTVEYVRDNGIVRLLNTCNPKLYEKGIVINKNDTICIKSKIYKIKEVN